MGTIQNKGGQPCASEIVQIAIEVAGKPNQSLTLGSCPEGDDFLGAPFTGRRKKDYERGLSYLHDMQGRVPTKAQVCLLGSCNPTTWRKDIAIPMLERAGVAYYNPQMPDWKPEMMQWEAEAKIGSYVLLFVFDGLTRAIGTISEAIEFIKAGRKVILCVEQLLPGTDIDGQQVTEAEAEDINEAREVLVQYAQAHACPVCLTVRGATRTCIDLIHDLGVDKTFAPLSA